jgi:hypothetical protein
MSQGRRKAARKFVRSIGSDPDRRAADDFYETPAQAVKLFTRAEKFEGPIWNPSCGRGSISKVLENEGYTVHSTDLVDRGYGKGGVDFLTCQKPRFAFNNIITNPPFEHAVDFAVRALGMADRKVCLLCRLLWLEGKKRRKLFERYPLAKVWVYSSRVSCSQMIRSHRASFFDEDEIIPISGNSMITFAWFCWDHSHKGPPTLGWL